MKTLNEIVREEMEKFDKHCKWAIKEVANFELDSGYDGIKNHIQSSHIHLLESVKEWAKGEKEINACYKSHEVCNCGKFETSKETNAYNQALSDIITHLSEQIKEINK